jgi:alpha-tubulin suppressor-like RCC1 family protein
LGDGNKNNEVLSPEQIVLAGVTAIASGDGHTLFTKNDGSLWGMGHNGYGALGDGTNEFLLRPKQLVAANVTRIPAGKHHSLFIKSDGSLWAMGLNDRGQVEDCARSFQWVRQPKLIASDNVVEIAAGSAGSLFLKNDGSLWAMGDDAYEDYGGGIAFRSRCPTQLVAADKAALVANYYYNAALKSTMSIWAKNFNNDVRLGGGAASGIGKAGLSVVNPPGNNLITIDLMENGDVRLTYAGDVGVNYALDRAYSLTTPIWLPQVTNTASAGGVLIITNTPDSTKNNFWRIRCLQ